MKNPSLSSQNVRFGSKYSRFFAEKTRMPSEFQTARLFLMARLSKKAWQSSKIKALASKNVRLAAS
jgi:hypothetical protein